MNTGLQVAGGVLFGLSAAELGLLTAGFTWALYRASFVRKGSLPKVLCAAVLVILLALRAAFCVPFLLGSLPMPSRKGRQPLVPLLLADVSLWTISVAYAASAVLPVVACFAGDLWHSLRQDSSAAPSSQIIALMNVDGDRLDLSADAVLHSIIRVCDSHYDRERMHVLVSFDGDRETPLYRETLAALGGPHTATTTTPPVCDLVFRSVHVTVCRFPHGRSMRMALELLQKLHKTGDSTEKYVVLLDTDTLLHNQALHALVSRRSSSGAVGVTLKKNSFFDDFEHVHSQKHLEVLLCGGNSVTCSNPGAPILIPFNVLDSITTEWLSRARSSSGSHLFDHLRLRLGADGHLAQVLATRTRGRVAFTLSARSEVEPFPGASFAGWMREKRNQFLGSAANDAVMLVTPEMWARHPLFMLYRLLHVSLVQHMSLTLYLLIVNAVMLAEQKKSTWLPPAAAAGGSFAVGFLGMLYFGVKYSRVTYAFYATLHAVFPLLRWLVAIYSCTTFTRRSETRRSHISPSNSSSNSYSNSLASLAARTDSVDIIAEYAEQQDPRGRLARKPMPMHPPPPPPTPRHRAAAASSPIEL